MSETSAAAGGDAVEILVVVVDDHPIIRDVTRRVLNEEADINVGADYSAVEDFLDSGISADVVVLDLSLSGRGGLEAIPDILVRYPECHILVLTMHANRSVCTAALERGATGFIGKGCHPLDLVSAVRAVAAGEQFVPADLLGPSATAPLSLSPDERVVVGRLADGRRLAAIADELGLTIWEANAMKSSLELRSRCRSVDDWRRLAMLQGIDHRR